MGRTILKGGRIFTGRAFVEGGAVLIDGGRIKAVYDRSDQCETRPGDDVRDIDGMIAAPGFVDIHIHGAMGCDAMDGTYDAIDTIARAIASRGTTSFLVTTMTASIDDTYNAIVAAGRAMKRGTSGAQVLGVHMEGPFINADHKGAQMESLILPPSMDAYRSMTGEYGHIVKRVTLAPEVEGALEISRYLHKNGILVSAGHTGASYDEMRRAYDAGVTHTTHLFNGMNPIHHREPGAPGAALTQDGWTVEVIADTVHLHPAILKMAWLCKGADRCALVTDAIEATLVGDGVYELGGQKVIVKGGQARLEAGNLAGSTLTLDKAVKNIVEAAGIPLADALKMASLTPAGLIGADGRKGCIEQGYDADIVLLDEADLSVNGAMIAGKWH
ncbi:N-acetylglucosamine-6-phosphate deacetylase [Mahella australiensis]|uniref:N-acetylglucosamine-6-phosphate deacetylase n=1 Tax=Mahella australiensis (strain DSM 15567 / CIP 107919 / 50-1 BON) TaxID=697281 RepID=F3ZWK3_MAHA5|nr:N-acetylglucosamine-6-phosphate deacetylase [Mahella australiensis]AEE95438.1 N-acetylglucosamine-6-phosphate deacetylase [Mahella australiensis 50-1 BON]